jgi:hypothetical protein
MRKGFNKMFSMMETAYKKVIKLLFVLMRGLLVRDKDHQARQMARLYKQARPAHQSAGTVLFWVPGGMPLMLDVEGAIAAALRLRGVHIHAIICDGPFRACVKREVNDGIPVTRWQESCQECKAQTRSVLDTMGIPYSFIGDFISESIRAELWDTTALFKWEALDDLHYGSVNLGKNARSAIIRYLKGVDLAGHEEVVREYAFSVLVCAAAAACAIDRLSPSRIYMSHGIYADWGPALQTALSRRIPVTAWMASYLTARFYFRHVEDGIRIDFHNLSKPAWGKCKDSALLPIQDERLDNFLVNRYKKHISFDMQQIKPYTGDMELLHQKYISDTNKPTWGIMCHLNWDCVSDYSPMAYDSFDEWILNTIREIVNIQNVNWLIKIHPAEAWDNHASGVQHLIDQHFPSLPPHVRVLPAEEEISPLEFFQLVDGGVTVYGTSGLELSLQGKPVILAGEAHYGCKGFTYDGLHPGAYTHLLRQAASLPRLSEEQLLLARRYAYCYFIQRQVPLSVVEDPNSSWWRFQFEKRNLLLPGRDSFIDFICERIMDGKDFIMDEKLVALLQKE